MSTPSDRVVQLQADIEPLRQRLLAHPVYAEIDALPKLRLFMEHHVFAVWDFMSLLKTLQRKLCCVEVPWIPPADAEAARLINDIVLGEETDVAENGEFASHYDLYHNAMTQAGADTRPVDRFLIKLRGGNSWQQSLIDADVPAAVSQFVSHTFEIIESGDLVAITAAFTFGREDLLPDVFQRIVDELSVQATSGLQEFRYYLARHIELDADEHGPMALRLMESLCGEDADAWQRATDAAKTSLHARRELWDAMLLAVQHSQAA